MSDTNSMYRFGKNKPTSAQLIAIARLQKDLMELKRNPFPDVVAEPLESNLFTWHGNLRGPSQSPFDGGVFHFRIQFPDNYPKNAPEIHFLCDLPSPFVSNHRACVNLAEPAWSGNRRWGIGWTPIYTVSSILSQLQSFLLDGLEVSENPPTGYNISFSQKQTSQWKEVFENRDQQGDGTLSPSEIRELMLEVGERKPSEEELALHYKMLHLQRDQPIEFSTFLTILQRKREYRKVVEAANRYHCTDAKCTHAPQKIAPQFPDVSGKDFIMKESYSDLTLSETVCYFTKNGFLAPDTATLGVGLSFQRNYRDGKLFKIQTPLDIISLNSFRKLGVSGSSDGASTITHWLPLYLNEEHGKRALHLASRCIGIIFSGSHRDFNPEMVLEVLPKLISGIVVDIINKNIYPSTKVIEGFCYLHRLFLALAERYPTVKELARNTIRQFLEEGKQTSADVPSLADFLSLLLIDDEVDLKKLFAEILQETDVRNVKWILQKFPELEKSTADPKLDAERIKKSFHTSIAGYQILLFYKYFLDVLARPQGKTLQQVAQGYDSLYGKPSVEQIAGLQVQIHTIQEIEDFSEVYIRLGFEPLSESQLLVKLREAISISEARNYHGKRIIQVQSPDEFLKEKLKGFASLESFLDEEQSKLATEKRGAPTLILREDESAFKILCQTRFGVESPPTELDANLEPIQSPWKHHYLKLNLEDILEKFNENPDFQNFYRTLELSASCLREIQFKSVAVTNIKSNFHYLTALLTRLWSLKKFTTTKGEIFLGLKGCKALCKGLKNNPNSIRVLDLHYSHFDSKCMKLLEEGLLASVGLISLNLEGNPLGSGGAASIAKVLRAHAGITHLNITSCGIDVNGAAQLAEAFYYNKSLCEIHLGKNDFGEGIIKIISQLAYHPSIKNLYLPRLKFPTSADATSRLSQSFVKLFEVSLSLESVNFFKTPVSGIFREESLHGLSQNRSLTSLDFSNSNLGSANVSHLGWAVARNKRITFLDLENSQIGSNAIQLLSEAIYDSIPAIEARAKAAAIRDLNANEIRESLRPRGCSLTSLNLSRNPSAIDSTAAISALSRLISLSHHLTHLQLSRCELGVLAGEAIGLGLKSHPTLTNLDLSRNSLGEHGAKKLCKGLLENSVLTHLDLSRNRIGGRGISAVANLISTCPSSKIQLLNLFGNQIGIEGARFIAKALQENRSVTDLDLGCNGMRPKGVSAIAQALSSNETLQILRLKLNFINDRTAMELCSALSSQKSIVQLCLAGNRIKDAILNSVSASLSAKETPVKLDVAELLNVTESSRLQRTVYCTPLPFSVSESSLKKIFYDGGCGAITNVAIKKHSKRSTWDKAMLAFVEFADTDSVLMALDIGASGNAKIGKARFKVIQAQGKSAKVFSKPKPQKPERRQPERSRHERRPPRSSNWE